MAELIRNPLQTPVVYKETDIRDSESDSKINANTNCARRCDRKFLNHRVFHPWCDLPPTSSAWSDKGDFPCEWITHPIFASTIVTDH
jgi:hypothetical protein